MSGKSFDYRFRKPLGEPEELGSMPPVYRKSLEEGMLVERGCRGRDA